jgi:hypothetical protein
LATLYHSSRLASKQVDNFIAREGCCFKKPEEYFFLTGSPSSSMLRLQCFTFQSFTFHSYPAILIVELMNCKASVGVTGCLIAASFMKISTKKVPIQAHKV